MGNVPKFDLEKEYGNIFNVKRDIGFFGEFDGTGMELLVHAANSDNYDNLCGYIGRFHSALDKREQVNHFIIDCDKKKGIYHTIVTQLPSDFKKGRFSHAIFDTLELSHQDKAYFLEEAMKYYQQVQSYQGKITKEQLLDKNLDLSTKDIEEFETVNNNYAKAQKNMASIAADQGKNEEAKRLLEIAGEYACSVGLKKRIQEQMLHVQGIIQPIGVSDFVVSIKPDYKI